MQVRTDKSANRIYREQRQAGMTQLSFKDWLITQKAKNFSNVTGTGEIPADPSLNSGIQDVLQSIHEEGGLKTQAGTTYVFGINKQVLIWTGVGVGALVTGVIIYKIIHRRK